MKFSLTPILCSLLLLSTLHVSAEETKKADVKPLRTITIPDGSLTSSDDPLTEEAREVVRHFLFTGDVNYASTEHKLTLLHLAAFTKNLKLVRKLCADGADPNACMQDWEGPSHTPASCVLRYYDGSPGQSAAIVGIMKALVEAGADLNTVQGRGQRLLLEYFSDSMEEHAEAEGVAIELMKLGAKGCAKTVGHMAYNGWKESLAYLLATDEAQAYEEKDLYLSSPIGRLSSDLMFDELTEPVLDDILECIRMLLRQHKDLATKTEKPNAPSPVYEVSRALTLNPFDEKSEAFRSRHIDLIVMLLARNANPYIREGWQDCMSYSCAADYIIASGWGQAMLKERRVNIKTPDHDLREKTLVRQLECIPVDAYSDEEARKYYELLSRLFVAPGELPMPKIVASTILIPQKQWSEYIDARGINIVYNNALTLMLRADADRTLRLIRELPDWSNPKAWEENAALMRGMYYAISRNKSLLLPADFLVETARKLEGAGKPRLAHAFIRLLKRHPEQKELIDELCTDATPQCMRAAAMSVRLHHAGLPTLYSLQKDDLGELITTPGTPNAVKQVLIAAKCLNIRYRNNEYKDEPELLHLEGYTYAFAPDKDYIRQGRKAAEYLRAPKAARLLSEYEKYSAHEDSNHIDKLSAPGGAATEASFELEEVTARHIQKNKRLFLRLMQKQKQRENSAS